MPGVSDQAGDPPSSQTSTIGLIGLLFAGALLGIGFLILFDTTHHLLSMYAGSVNSPLEIWVRVIITAVLGSTFVLASLSVVIQ